MLAGRIEQPENKVQTQIYVSSASKLLWTHVFRLTLQICGKYKAQLYTTMLSSEDNSNFAANQYTEFLFLHPSYNSNIKPKTCWGRVSFTSSFYHLLFQSPDLLCRIEALNLYLVLDQAPCKMAKLRPSLNPLFYVFLLAKPFLHLW